MRRDTGSRASPVVSGLMVVAAVAVAVAGAYVASVWSTRRPPVGESGAFGGTASRGGPAVPPALPTPAVREAGRATAPPPSPTPPDHRLSITLPWASSVAATPTPNLLRLVERRAPTPRPTPSVAHCVAASWSTSMSAAAPGQVLVEVTARNYCGRVLAPLDVWFRVSGYRHGAVVHSVMGHPFDPIGGGDQATTVIGLPGSIDWYDRIDVEVLGGGR